MRKIFMISVAGLLLFTTSCDNKKAKEREQQLQAQIDSLSNLNRENQTELTEMNNLIDMIESNFQYIRETEKVLLMDSQEGSSLSGDKKERIQMDMDMIKGIMAKNKADLDKLNQKVKNGYGEVANLKKRIDNLNKELEERSKTIVQLQSTLEKKNAYIAQLESNYSTIKSAVDSLDLARLKNEQRIQEQAAALNTAYYAYGTAKELKDADIAKGGFLRSTKLDVDGLDKSRFVVIDIRETRAIPLNSKKAKLLSSHPDGSYSFDKAEDGLITLNITDYQDFWSLTRFLVIEIK